MIITSGEIWEEDFKKEYKGLIAFNEAMEIGTPLKKYLQMNS